MHPKQLKALFLGVGFSPHINLSSLVLDVDSAINL